MTHVLDNPIWNALITANKQWAYGNEQAKYIHRDIGLFAGLRSNSKSDLEVLQAMVPVATRVILFAPEELDVPVGWKVALQKELQQMVYLQQQPVIADREGLIPLQDKDIPAMLALTALTNPGPFLKRTINFGHYEGIFEGHNLVAMTGQRLQPTPYTEVSAVCTHPAHTGKGYAAKLVLSQIAHIMAASSIPFLHVYPDNTAACKLYEKLGFLTRRQLLVYVLEKTA